MKNYAINLFLVLTMLGSFAFKEDSFLAWRIAYNQNGIRISYDVSSCQGKPMLFWKFENSTGQERIINVNGSIVEGINSQNIHFRITVNPGSIEGNCQNITSTSPCLTLMQSFINPSVTLTVN